jgi:tetratricopeptide (TPR) repeat protein
MDVTGSQGVQLGDGNVQINLFTGGQPRGPVVAGNIPQPAPAFQPREDLMAALREAGSGVCVVRAVTGLRGVGKTQLAAAYARDRRQAGWRLVAWVNSETTPALLDGLAVVADRLGIERAGKTLEGLGLEVRNRLEADGGRCLIVFDNVADPDAITPYVPSVGDPQVLITSTESSVTALGDSVQVEVFTDEEALAFLAARTRLDDEPGARLLATELGCLPLALAQAAAVIAARRLTYPVYLDRLRAYPAEKYLPAARGEPYPRGVAEAISLSIDSVAAGLYRQLLSVVSLLSADGVSRELLYLGASADVFAASPEELDEALAGLASASLLGFSRAGSANADASAADASTVTAHRLVMRITRERAAHDDTLPELAAKAVRLLYACIRSVGEPWQNRPAARAFVRQTSALTANVASAPDVADDKGLLNLRSWALWCLNKLADTPSEAVQAGQQLVADNERVRGNADLVTVMSQGQLASAYDAAGRPADAVSLGKRVLAQYERLVGPSHLDTTTIRHNLGQAYLAAGRLGDAVPLLEQVLGERGAALGDSDPDTLATGHALAAAYRDAGRRDDAVPLFTSVLAERERVLGPSHPDTLGTRNDLAAVYSNAGRLDEAVPLLERGLAEYRRLLGPSHPYTLTAGSNLALAYQRAGQLGQALPLFEQLLADGERVLGRSHPSTLTTMNNLALAYRDAGRLDEAVLLLEEVVDGLDRALGPEHPRTVTARDSLTRARAAAARIKAPEPGLSS